METKALYIAVPALWNRSERSLKFGIAEVESIVFKGSANLVQRSQQNIDFSKISNEDMLEDDHLKREQNKKCKSSKVKRSRWVEWNSRSRHRGFKRRAELRNDHERRV
jgi:hypothetical protein